MTYASITGYRITDYGEDKAWGKKKFKSTGRVAQVDRALQVDFGRNDIIVLEKVPDKTRTELGPVKLGGRLYRRPLERHQSETCFASDEVKQKGLASRGQRVIAAQISCSASKPCFAEAVPKGWVADSKGRSIWV